MKKVMFISGCGGDTQRYRVFNQMEQLKTQGIEVVEYEFTDYNIYPNIKEYDNIIMHRTPYIEYIESVINKAHKFGNKVYFDIDDIVFDKEYAKYSDGINYLSEQEKKLYFEGIERYKKVIQLCDGVIVSTEFLKMAAEKFNTNVYINRNALGEQLIQISEKVNSKFEAIDDDKIRIGYFSGSKTHNKDFEEVTEALYELMQEITNIVLVIGGLLDLPNKFKKFEDRIERKPLVHWTELPAIIKSVDINLAPLEDNPFCKAKSELKYIEAAILKVPTVASKIDAFEVAIKDGHNGVLASNKLEWKNGIKRLIADKEFYTSIQQTAYNDVLVNYTPVARGKQFVNTLEMLDKNINQKIIDCKGFTINFLIPQPFKGSGGHTTILRMIRGLVSNGHQVNVYVQKGDNFEVKNDKELKRTIDEYFFETNASYYMDKGNFKDSDVFIATSWPTSYVVNGIKNTKKKMYFIQDFEPYFYPMSSEYKLAENSYKLGLTGITIGSWLTEFVGETYNMDCDYIDFALDNKIYKFEDIRSTGEKTKIIFYARAKTPRRGFELAIQALDRVYNLYKDKVEIILFGGNNLQEYDIPFKYTDVGVLNEKELNKLYNEAHIALVCSLTNCSLLPLELMATKCAVVDIDSPTVKGIMQNGVDSLLAHPDPYNISENLIALINDKQLREEITNNAFNKIQDLNWERSVEQFENILICKTAGANKGALIRSYQEKLYREIGVPVCNINKTYITKIKIDCTQDYFHRIDLFVGNYGIDCKGEIIINIKSGLNQLIPIASERKSLRGLRDNEWINLEFTPIRNSKGKTYFVELYTTSEDLALYGMNNQEDANILVDNINTQALATAYVYYKKEYNNSEVVLMDGEHREDNNVELESLVNSSINIQGDQLLTQLQAVLTNTSNKNNMLYNKIIMLEDEIKSLNTEIILMKDSLPVKIYSKTKTLQVLKPLKKLLKR